MDAITGFSNGVSSDAIRRAAREVGQPMPIRDQATSTAKAFSNGKPSASWSLFFDLKLDKKGPKEAVNAFAQCRSELAKILLLLYSINM